MKPRMVEDNADHYVMHDGRSPFHVPKGGLSEDMHAKIRAMAVAPKMAEGGDVGLAAAGGGPPTEDPRNYPVPAEPNASFQPPASPQQVAAEVAASPTLAARIFGGATARPAVGEGPSQGIPPGATGGGPGASTPESLRLGGTDMAPQERVPGAPVVSAPAAGSRLGVPEMEAAKARRAFEAARGVGEPAEGVPAAVPKPAPTAPVSGVGFGPDPALKEGLAALKDQKKAVAAGAELERTKQASLTQLAIDRQNQLQAAALDDKAANDKALMVANEAITRSKEIHDRIAKVDASVDPGRYWASRSTGGKIAGVIGLVLGAIGAGNDGVNRAAGLMNQAIDRDIDAQKAEHELRLKRGGQELESSQQLYSQQHAALQDDIAARHAAKASALELAAARADEVAATASGAGAKNQAAMLAAQLRLHGSALMAEAHKRKMEEAKLALLAGKAGAKTAGDASELSELEGMLTPKVTGVTGAVGKAAESLPWIETHAGEYEAARQGMILRFASAHKVRPAWVDNAWPRAGDKPAIVRQKLNQLRQMAAQPPPATGGDVSVADLEAD